MSSIYHFENYIQMQKLNLVLKIRFNHDKLASLPLWGKWIKTFYTIQIELGLEFTVRPGYSLCSHTENVKELMFKKYFKILLVFTL